MLIRRVQFVYNLLEPTGLNKKYRAVREDENKEKGYTSLDKLAKLLIVSLMLIVSGIAYSVEKVNF